MKPFLFFLVFLPVVAAGFAYQLLAIAFRLGRIFGRQLTEWIRR